MPLTLIITEGVTRTERDADAINVTHAVDGSWGSDGKAYTNAGVGDAVGAG